MYIEDIIAACRRVIDGDDDALQQLGLDTIQYRRPRPFNTGPMSLQTAYNHALHLAVAARELDMGTLELQAQMSLMLMASIAESTNVTIDHRVDGADVAEVMLSLIDEETARLRSIQPVPEDRSDADEQPIPSSSSLLVTTPNATASASPVPVPSSFYPSSPSPSAANLSTTAGASSQRAKSSIDIPSADKTCGQQHPASSSSTSSAPYKKAASKNKRRHCSLCPFFGTHLDRHLDTQHPGSFQSKREKVSLLHAKDKLSAPKTIPRFQCTYQSCGSIVTRLGQHLTRTHKITNAKLLAQVKASCIRIPSAGKPSPAAPKPQHKPAPQPIPTDSSESESESESESQAGTFVSSGSSTDEHREVDNHELQVEADLDNISSYADTDAEDEDVAATTNTTWHQVYTSKSSDQSLRHYFMARFYRYLLHVEGGAHSQQQALIHTRQVHTILDTLDPEGNDLSCLARRRGLDVWDKFCVPKLSQKKLTGNSIKTYLRSLEYFFKFISKGLLYNEDLLDQTQKHSMLQLRERLPDYRSTIHRRTAHQVTTRKVDEAISRILPSDLRQVEASEQAQSAIKLLGLAQEEKRTFNQTEFLAIRDYLLVTTLYENASRPGPLENCLIARFNQATYSESTKRYTILVDKHKTTRHQGPAELTVTSRLYSYLQIYVLKVRPHFAAPREDALFVKVDGLAFNPGTISKRVSQFFIQAGIRKDVRVTATTIRKMVSDKAYEMSPTKNRLIHHHMKHQERTADANYVIKVNADRASRAHALVSGIIQESGDSPALSSSSTSDSDDDVPLAQACNKPMPALPSTSQRGSLSDEHKSVLLTAFQKEIATGQLLTTQEVRSRMRTNNVLRIYVVQPDFVKRATDFVRYKTNTTRQQQLTSFPDLDPDDGVASLSNDTGSRKLWSAPDTAVIESKFKGQTKVPPKREIMATFRQDPVLSHILEREGETRCYEKVKTLLRRSAQ